MWPDPTQPMGQPNPWTTLDDSMAHCLHTAYTKLCYRALGIDILLSTAAQLSEQVVQQIHNESK